MKVNRCRLGSTFDRGLRICPERRSDAYRAHAHVTEISSRNPLIRLQPITSSKVTFTPVQRDTWQVENSQQERKDGRFLDLVLCLISFSRPGSGLDLLDVRPCLAGSVGEGRSASSRMFRQAGTPSLSSAADQTSRRRAGERPGLGTGRRQVGWLNEAGPPFRNRQPRRTLRHGEHEAAPQQLSDHTVLRWTSARCVHLDEGAV